MAEYFTVTVDAEVLHIEDPVQLLDRRSKQNFMISDRTHYIKLTLWEAEVGRLKKYQCYHVSNLLIREFRGEKYITTRKEGTKIEDISDMANVTNEEYPEPDDPSVKIIGVESVSSFKSCINCKCRVIKMEGEDEIAQCTKCNTVQFMAETKYLLSANFTLKTTSEEKIHVPAYGNILLDICENKDCTDITSTSLLKAKPFIVHAVDGTIHSIKCEVITPFNINQKLIHYIDYIHLYTNYQIYLYGQ